MKRKPMQEQQAQDFDPTLRLREVAERTGLSRYTVRNEIDTGELPSIRIGSRKDRHVQLSALTAYCRRLGLKLRGSS